VESLTKDTSLAFRGLIASNGNHHEKDLIRVPERAGSNFWGSEGKWRFVETCMATGSGREKHFGKTKIAMVGIKNLI